MCWMHAGHMCYFLCYFGPFMSLASGPYFFPLIFLPLFFSTFHSSPFHTLLFLPFWVRLVATETSSPIPARPLPAAPAAVSKIHCSCLATSHTVFPSNRTTGGVCQSWTSVHLQPPHPPFSFSITLILSSLSFLYYSPSLCIPHALSFKWLSV